MSRNEAETRAELIDPVLTMRDWGKGDSRIRREEITPGRIQGQGRRSRNEFADYVFYYHDQKLAVLEAKRESLGISEGKAQAVKYAEKLGARFAYASNGHGFYLVDLETGHEQQMAMADFPTPDQMWKATFAEENEWRNRFAAVPFEDRSGAWQPRYYQHNAITRIMEAIATGKDRILLTLATGTGKTAISFQIAWKLFHSRWTVKRDTERRPRILFLADRNILADQAFNAFSAFPEDALVRIAPSAIKKKGRVPKNGNIFFTIFQTFMTGTDDNGNPAPNYGEYPPDFFDFIIIDECHRGGANDESNWRGILEYFAPAVQLGLTATPKRTDNADTYRYFGEPVYTYSLKEGINDGFLTPFKVKQIQTTLDEYVYTSDDEVIEGEIEEGKRYTEKDFNRVIEIKEREEHRVNLFMKMIDQGQKTIVFCSTQHHALAVRDLVNQKSSSTNPHYCCRVTADDGAEGETYLAQFQDNEKTIPTILTTSQKLSTGVDARNVRNIVLMRPVNSMIEFKQIIGRGTRLFDGKDFFTIYDFVQAYKNFDDPDWDGEPERCDVCGELACICEDEGGADPPGGDEPRVCEECGQKPCVCEKEGDEPCPDCGRTKCICKKGGKKKVTVKLADGKAREIQNMTTTTFWSPDGKPMSAIQFMEELYGQLPELFTSEKQLREIWSSPETRRKLLEGLAEKGFGQEQLSEMRSLIDANDSDIFDVLAYVAYASSPVTRQFRVEKSRQQILAEHESQEQEFLEFVLAQYVKEGVQELDDEKLPDLIELKYKALADAVRQLGDIKNIRGLFLGLQPQLYAVKEWYYP